MENHDELINRLRALGDQPVDPGTASHHRTLMATVAGPPTRRSRMRPAVAGAILAGALLGGGSLAGALTGHNLPDAASDAAQDAIAKVTGNDDHENKGKSDEARDEHQGEDHGVTRHQCTGQTEGENHGQYVKAHPDDEATTDVNERQVAAQSDCGKPVQSIHEEGSDGNRPADAGKPESPGQSDEDHGKPTGAGAPAADNDSDDAGKPESPGKSADHKPTTTTTTTGS